MSASPILTINNLEVDFHTGSRPISVLRDINLQLQPGEILGLVGESGSGKSVTGLSIMGLLGDSGKIKGGEIILNNRPLHTLSQRAWQHVRGKEIAMIFQDPMSTLHPLLSIETQMIESIFAHEKISKKAAYAKAVEALTQVGIADAPDRLRLFPHQMSGGMRQRVAIAIALLHGPALMIADEPTTALDVTIQAQILSLMQRLVQERGTSLIWISHDLSVVAGLVDSIAVMYAGQIVEHGRTDAVLDSPQHPYTKGLMDSLTIHAEKGKRLVPIPGMAPQLSQLPTGCAFAPRCRYQQATCNQIAPALSQHPHAVRCHFPLQISSAEFL